MSETGWQPIETAPKDGRMVLVYCGSTSFVHQRLDLMSYSGWWRTIRGGLAQTPTHWAPIPEPPK